MALSILVFLLVLFSFICGRFWGYSDGYSAGIRDANSALRKAAKGGIITGRKLSSQEA